MSVVMLSTGYFPDPDTNRPVSLGYIYVGVPDLDPTVEANQKQISVLQEDTTTVDVSQPLRTSAGGVPVYNGSPVTILVEGDHSLTVLSSALAQVYYIPSASETVIEDYAVGYVETLAALKALTTTSPVYMIGRVSSNDGGQGHFDWDSSDLSTEVATDTLWGIYVPPDTDSTGASGAWVRQTSGYFKPEWWGYSSAATALNNRTSFNAALQAMTAGGKLYISPGSITSDLTAGGFTVPIGGITIYGAGEVSELVLTNVGAADVFNSGGFNAVRFHDFKITGDGSNTGAGVNLSGAGWRSKSWRMFISGMRDGIILNGWHLVARENYCNCTRYGIMADLDRPQAVVIELKIMRNYIAGSGTNGIYLNKVRSSCILDNDVGSSGGDGILSQGNSLSNRFEGNHCEGGGGNGISIISNTSPKIASNRCLTNAGYAISCNNNKAGSLDSNRGALNFRRVISGDNAAIASASTTLTVDTAAFLAANHVGGAITVDGAGVAGADLVTTVASWTSTTEVELTDAASTTVTDADVLAYGLDSTSTYYITDPQDNRPMIVGGNNQDVVYNANVDISEVVDLDSIGVKGGVVSADTEGTHTGPVNVSSTRTSLFAVNKTVVDNTTVNFMTFTSTVAGFAGIITIVARAEVEDSSHIYHITSDATGYTLTELGVGRDRNGTIACTATITGAEGTILTLTADTTANDWAASPLVTIKADITAAGLITTLEL